MCYLLMLETSTKVCSVALTNKNKILSIVEEINSGFSHSSQLTLFIERVLKKSGLSLNNLSGVAVSRGPGSYTGLRIGASVAKGLCYALDIPLLSVNTLKAMANVFLTENGDEIKNDNNFLLCPMIDARRMEVYNAIYNSNLEEIKPVAADIIEKNSFNEFLDNYKIWFFGDGASKCKSIINSPNAYFCDDIFPSAKGMYSLAYDNFADKKFEDTAYFEPYYLKDFIGGKPKVKGLYS